MADAQFRACQAAILDQQAAGVDVLNGGEMHRRTNNRHAPPNAMLNHFWNKIPGFSSETRPKPITPKDDNVTHPRSNIFQLRRASDVRKNASFPSPTRTRLWSTIYPPTAAAPSREAPTFSYENGSSRWLRKNSSMRSSEGSPKRNTPQIAGPLLTADG